MPKYRHDPLPSTRRCPGCLRVLPLTADFWHVVPKRNPWTASYWKSPCRQCNAEKARRWRQAHPPGLEAQKRRERRQRQRQRGRHLLGLPDGKAKADAYGAVALKRERQRAQEKALRRARRSAAFREAQRIRQERGLPYVSWVEMKIRNDCEEALRRRLERGSYRALLKGANVQAEPLDQEQLDYLHQLQQLRDRHQREAAQENAHDEHQPDQDPPA